MINEFRENLNNKVEKLGNKIKPDLFKCLGLPGKYGLGNLLTTDVNFTRLGAVTGVALPFVAAYEYMDLISRNIPPSGGDFVTNTIFSIMVNAGLLFIPSGVGGIFGALAGKELDKYLDDKYYHLLYKLDKYRYHK